MERPVSKIPVSGAVALFTCLVVFSGNALAVEGGATGWWTDKEGRNYYGNAPSQSSGRSHSSSSSSSSSSSYNSNYAAAGMASQLTASIISSMQAQQMQAVQNMQNAVAMNNQAVVFHDRGDYDTAISCYEEALRLNPYNGDIAANMAKAKAARANKRAEEALARFDDEAAAGYLREYLSYGENAEARRKLKEVEEKLEFDRKMRERDERLKNAKSRVDQAVGDLAEKLGGTPAVDAGADAGGMDFIGGENSFKGDKGVVDLTGIEPGKPVVIDPAGMKGAENGAHYRDVPAPKGVVPEWDPYSVSTKAEIILDAVKNGNKKWDNSVAYLERYLESKNSHNMKVRDALSYIEGLRDGALECEGPPKKGLFDPENQDSAALMEVIAGDKMGRPQPRPDVMGWKSDRMKLMLEAAKKGNNNWDASVKYLDDRIKKDPTDYTAMQARSYMEGVRAYEEYFQKTNQNKK